MDFLYIFVGILFGAISIWFFAKYRFEKNKVSQEDYDSFLHENKKLNSDLIQSEIENEVANEKTSNLLQNLTDIKFEFSEQKNSMNIELAKLQEKIIELNKELSKKIADNENVEKRHDEQKAELEQIRNRFNLEFKNIANEILEDKSKKFTEENKTNLGILLNPLNEKIKDFEKRVEETYDKESKQRFSLQNEIKNLVELNQRISTEANNLTNALKGQSKTQGNWGEMILENILETSGLVKNREYFIQQSVKNEEGKRYQPDVLIHYPGEKILIIDSKVSLNAYERFANSHTKNEQEIALNEHIQAIKNHINDLSSKNYQDMFSSKSLDFVMMFLPIEPAYMLAIQHDDTIWNYAYNKRILLISPTNLIASLKLISSIWKQEYQSQNVFEIAKQSGALYDKFVGFIEDVNDIGKKLDSTKKSYESSINKLYEGKGNLVKRAEDIKNLGAKTKKVMPSNFEN
ncbi:MAG: DNA recombination protein RmuC [Bacteroidetes bacterium]|jgi:DNA recombination protein RmuC|nr:DNA recombination protein RmuC [Bacteroidota bacterium]MBT6685857.1 DNA recombination protein RmuC [Bacteroidota bacterium]MBT7142574.1 DNA recombination protein RmuC [Bacteroidota bacterium]MBT7492144.1 DNA recombination protein RmuC [Bacteroidota bacterium]